MNPLTQKLRRTSGGLVLTYPDITIEWWQNMTVSQAWPRVFSVGLFPAAGIAVSIENGTFYFWVNNTVHTSFSIGTTGWVHIAITRVSGTLKIYVGGVAKITMSPDNFVVTDKGTPLYIGSETNSGTYFTGYITDFRWVKDTPIYTGNFTPPTTPLTAVPGTKLLLGVNDAVNYLKDSSTFNRTITGVGSPVYSSMSPYIGAGAKGSIYFNGASYITVPASIDWAFL